MEKGTDFRAEPVRGSGEVRIVKTVLELMSPVNVAATSPMGGDDAGELTPEKTPIPRPVGDCDW